MAASIAIHGLVLAALLTEPQSASDSAEQVFSVTEMVIIEVLPERPTTTPVEEEEKALPRPGKQDTASIISPQPPPPMSQAGRPQHPLATSKTSRQLRKAGPAVAQSSAQMPTKALPVAQLSLQKTITSQAPTASASTAVSQSAKQQNVSRESERKLVRKHLEAFKFYPASARRRGIEGHVNVAFTLAQNGTATGVAVLQGSGHSVLDQAAMKTVFRAQPFPVNTGEFRFRLRFKRL